MNAPALNLAPRALKREVDKSRARALRAALLGKATLPDRSTGAPGRKCYCAECWLSFDPATTCPGCGSGAVREHLT